MAQAYEFTRQTFGMTPDEIRSVIASFGAESFPDQLRPEGEAVVVFFADHSSVFVTNLRSSRAVVLPRS